MSAKMADVHEFATDDWHPADVKAALEKEGYSLRQLAKKHGYAHFAKVLYEPWLAAEAIVADAVGVPAELIWPSRYQQERHHAEATTRKIRMRQEDTLKKAAEDSETREQWCKALGERLRVQRASRSRKAVAEAAGVHMNTLVRYESGDAAPDAYTLHCLAKVLGTTAAFLLDGKKNTVDRPWRCPHAVDTDDVVLVPDFGRMVRCDADSFQDARNVRKMRAFPRELIRDRLGIQHRALALLEMTGDTMRPSIRDGDGLLVDLERTRGEGLHAVVMDGNLMIRFVQRLPGNVLRVVCENRDYAAFEVCLDDVGETFLLLGRVVCHERRC